MSQQQPQVVYVKEKRRGCMMPLLIGLVLLGVLGAVAASMGGNRPAGNTGQPASGGNVISPRPKSWKPPPLQKLRLQRRT